MENKKISWNNVHDKINQKVTKLISNSDFVKWVNENIEIKLYIPIAQKFSIASSFSENFQKDVDFLLDRYSEIKLEDMPIIHMTYVVNQLLMLLREYTNIDVSKKDATVKNYDLIVSSGLREIILSVCSKDYVELTSYCDKITGINHFDICANMLNIKIPDEKQTRNIVKQIKKIDDTDIKKIKDINAINNPRVQRIVDKINQEPDNGVLAKDAIKEIINKVKKNGK